MVWIDEKYYQATAKLDILCTNTNAKQEKKIKTEG